VFCEKLEASRRNELALVLWTTHNAKQIGKSSSCPARNSHEYMCKMAFFQIPLTGHVVKFLLSPMFWDTHGGSLGYTWRVWMQT
jgi:hypothetical protein